MSVKANYSVKLKMYCLAIKNYYQSQWMSVAKLRICGVRVFKYCLSLHFVHSTALSSAVFMSRGVNIRQLKFAVLSNRRAPSRCLMSTRNFRLNTDNRVKLSFIDRYKASSQGRLLLISDLCYRSSVVSIRTQAVILHKNFDHFKYRISNNSRPSIDCLPRIIARLWRKYSKYLPPLRIIAPPPPPPLTTIGNPLSIPTAENLEDEAEVEFDPAKLISDDAEDIDN